MKMILDVSLIIDPVTTTFSLNMSNKGCSIYLLQLAI